MFEAGFGGGGEFSGEGEKVGEGNDFRGGNDCCERERDGGKFDIDVFSAPCFVLMIGTFKLQVFDTNNQFSFLIALLID